jgi:hypothetical protein
MADVAIISPAVSSPEITLTANEVQTVTFDLDVNDVEVISDGAATVRWTCDGSTPSATHGYFIPALVAIDTRRSGVLGNTAVHLWSNGTPTVVVQRAD